MKRFLLVGLVTLFFVTSGYTQAWKYRRYEIYGGIPTFHYFGDIGGSADKSNLFGLKDISLRAIRPGFAIGGIYRANEKFSIMANYNFGLLSQTDKGSRNEARNFAFTTLINEVSVQGMFFIIPEKEKNYYYSVMQLRGGLKQFNKPLSVYVFGGIGATFFSVTPKESFVGSERFTSKSFTPAVPVGVGVKFAFTSQISFGAELGFRYLLTDYVDGFTSVSSKHNDLYYVMNFKVIYRFKKTSRNRYGSFR